MHVRTSCSASMEHFLPYEGNVVPVLPSVVHLPSDSEVASKPPSLSMYTFSSGRGIQPTESLYKKSYTECKKKSPCWRSSWRRSGRNHLRGYTSRPRASLVVVQVPTPTRIVPHPRVVHRKECYLVRKMQVGIVRWC